MESTQLSILASNGNNMAPYNINIDDSTCYYITKYVLSSHDIDQHHINWAINYVCSLYSSHGHHIKQQLINFLVYANQRGVCKFARIFNNALDNAIISKRGVGALFLLPNKEMMPEVYDNTLLTTSEKHALIRMISREKYAMSNMYDHIYQHITNYGLYPYGSHQIYNDVCGDNNLEAVNKKCYNDVCIQDTDHISNDRVRNILSAHQTPPSKIYTIDHSLSDGNESPQIYCFDILDLMEVVVDHQHPINPITKRPFSKFALNNIYKKYNKEISMYKRYKNNV